MKAFLMVIGALVLLAGAGATAMVLLRNRRDYDEDDVYQPDIPRPTGISDSARDQQADPYYGGDQLGKAGAEAHFAAQS